MLTSDLPVFVQPADGVLQALLLFLWEDVSQLIAGLQEHTQNPLVQLAKVVLCERKRRRFHQWTSLHHHQLANYNANV